MHAAVDKSVGAPSTNLTGQGSAIYVSLLCAVAALGGLLFGFDTAIINGALDFLYKRFQVDPGSFSAGFVVGSAIVGCIPGVLLAGPFSDRFGRKKLLILSAVLYFVSAIGSATPRTMAAFNFYRFIGGMGIGAASMASPLYIAEVAPTRLRGALVSLNQLTIIIGILLSYIASYFLKDLSLGWENWQWMFGSAAVPAVLFLLAMLLVPESPRWLTGRNRQAEAFVVLARVAGRTEAESQLREIRNSLALDQTRDKSDSIRQLFGPGLRVALAIGVVLAILQQITGINTVIYYSTSTFKDAGLGENGAFLGSVGVGLVNFIFTIIAMAFVEKVGRKPLLVFGPLAMGLSLGVLGLAFGLDGE